MLYNSKCSPVHPSLRPSVGETWLSRILRLRLHINSIPIIMEHSQWCSYYFKASLKYPCPYYNPRFFCALFLMDVVFFFRPIKLNIRFFQWQKMAAEEENDVELKDQEFYIFWIIARSAASFCLRPFCTYIDSTPFYSTYCNGILFILISLYCWLKLINSIDSIS